MYVLCHQSAKLTTTHKYHTYSMYWYSDLSMNVFSSSSINKHFEPVLVCCGFLLKTYNQLCRM